MKVKSCSALDLELNVLRDIAASIFHKSSFVKEKKSVKAIGGGGDDGGVWRHRFGDDCSFWLISL